MSLIHVHKLKRLPNHLKWTVVISKWEIALSALDRINIPCLMHDTHICQIDHMTSHSQEAHKNHQNQFTLYIDE